MVGILATAKTPSAVVERLHQASAHVLAREDTRERFLSSGAEVVASSPDEFAAQIKAEMAKWGKVIRNAGIREE